MNDAVIQQLHKEKIEDPLKDLYFNMAEIKKSNTLLLVKNGCQFSIVEAFSSSSFKQFSRTNTCFSSIISTPGVSMCCEMKQTMI